ncbi:MAG: hypothetical protein ABIF77_20920 [bacterium]
MRLFFISLLLVSLLAGPALAGLDRDDPDDRDDRDNRDDRDHHHGHHLDISGHVLDGWQDVSIDIEDGTLSIEHDDRGDLVEVTEDYDLYVNDKHIRTDRQETALLEDFYKTNLKLQVLAMHLGRDGVEIGAEGVKLAATALTRLVKLLSPDYDADDLEAEMEREAEKLEAKAEKLEEKGEVLEEMADRIEELAEELAERIPELDELGWFGD